MNNRIYNIFNAFSPKEQKSKILHKILNQRDSRTYGATKKNQYFYGWKSLLRAVVACALCLFIMAGVFMFRGGNTFNVYAYGDNIQITDTGVQLSTGVIRDGGEMQGQLMQMYIKGENIDAIRFSCKNQYIDFTDWTESRSNFSMEKQFTVPYGKKTSDYGLLVVNWNPKNTISQLTNTANSSIKNLSKELRNDIIVMEVNFLNGSKQTKSIDITLDDNGKISAKVQDYIISKNDDFVLNSKKSLPQQLKNNSEEEFKNNTPKYSQTQIQDVKLIVKKYYSKFSGNHEIVKIEYTEDIRSINYMIPDKYKDSDIMAFKAYERSMYPNISRTIIFAKEKGNNDWIVINEGY